MAQLAAGDAAGAVATYRTVLGLVPGSAVAHRALGQALLAAGQIDEAAAHAGEAVRLGPEDGLARDLLQRAAAAQRAAPLTLARTGPPG
jgi:predicted TPR repeat methyltransferase